MSRRFAVWEFTMPQIVSVGVNDDRAAVQIAEIYTFELVQFVKKRSENVA